MDKTVVKLLTVLIIFISSTNSFSQDTAKIRKQVAKVLKKHGIDSFQLKVNSTNQSGGQTAYTINNNYNGTNNHVVNGTNNGVNGNVNINSEKRLTEPEKKAMLKFIAKAMKDSSLSCITILNSLYTNGAKFSMELKEALILIGYKVNDTYGIPYPAIKGYEYSINKKRCLEITIGTF